MKRGGKGQAAMEFLMTYGWTLLVVLAAISAMAFFGVFKTSKLTPEQCNLGPGFACADYKIDSGSSNISLSVQNGYGKSFDLFVVYVQRDDPSSTTEVCGGKAGFIAGTPYTGIGTCWGTQKPPSSFKDGENLLVYHRVSNNPSNPPIMQGISCSSVALTTCCSQFSINMFSALIGNNICAGYAPCTIYTLTKGKKYSFDLVLIYIEQGSTLIHQRIGSLSGEAE